MKIFWIKFKASGSSRDTLRQLFLTSRFGYEYNVMLEKYIEN